jgi:hypothetical protein
VKRTFNLLATIAVVLSPLNLSGCMILDGRSYHEDRGDLVSDDGDIRYVGWCDVHTHSRDCTPARVAVADARQADEPE